MAAIPDAARWPHDAERVKWIRANYRRDGRLFSETPRDEWWMVGKLFRLTVRGWLEVEYDSDGFEVGCVVSEKYRQWIQDMAQQPAIAT